MIPRNLDWVHSLVNCLNLATENLITYNANVKGRNTLLTVRIKKKFHTRDEIPVRNICKAFAMRNDCKLRGIVFGEDKIELAISTKYENGPTSKKDPLMEDGNDKRASKEKETMD